MDELIPMLHSWCTPRHLLAAMLTIAILWMTLHYLRRKHSFRSLLIGAGSGIGALLLCHFYGASWGCALPLTLYTLGISALGGIPAVLLLCGLNYIFPQ